MDVPTNSYQRYKSDTNVFTTGLSRAAVSCGYAPPEILLPTANLSLAERLRAQAEKKAKKWEEKKTLPSAAQKPASLPTITHSVRTQDLIKQAKLVAQNPKFQLPDVILRVVERAIDARKRCTAWFERTKFDNGQSTEGHVHFVRALETAIHILKSSWKDDTKSQEVNLDKSSNKKSGSGPHDLSGLRNRFSNLKVEDIEDIEEVELGMPTAVKKDTSNRQLAASKDSQHHRTRLLHHLTASSISLQLAP